MASKKRHEMGAFIRQLIMLIPNILNLVTNLTSLIQLETKLAGRSLVTLISLAVVFGTLLVSSWLIVMGIIFLILQTYQWSLMQALLLVFALNIVLLGLIGFLLAREKKELFYPGTRRLLKNIRSNLEDV